MKVHKNIYNITMDAFFLAPKKAHKDRETFLKVFNLFAESGEFEDNESNQTFRDFFKISDDEKNKLSF